jgi:predicted O-linked N-acetylglucosamine transferase (SPINDLY family)
LEGLSWEEYINHCGKASVLLDPLYFGAGNSFYESMFYGTPTISLPTKYTKSRLVLGAYNQMDISNVNFNPISNSLDDYVSKAVETANKPNLFELKQELKSKAHKKLYENKDSIIDLEMIFKKIVS